MNNIQLAASAAVVSLLAGQVTQAQAGAPEVSRFTNSFGTVGMVTDGKNYYPTSNGKVIAIDTDLCDSNTSPDRVVVVTHKATRSGDVNTQFSTIRANASNLSVGFVTYDPDQDGSKPVNPATKNYADGGKIKAGFYSSTVLLNQANGHTHSTVNVSVDWPNIKENCGGSEPSSYREEPRQEESNPNACNGSSCGVGGGNSNSVRNDPPVTNPDRGNDGPPGPNPDAGAGVGAGDNGLSHPDSGPGGPPGPNASISDTVVRGTLGTQFQAALALADVTMVTPKPLDQSVLKVQTLKVTTLG